MFRALAQSVRYKSVVAWCQAQIASLQGRNPRWPECRKQWLQTHPMCIGCGGTRHLQVHHKKPVHLYPNLELDTKNLITLCAWRSRQCHLRIGHLFDWKAYNPRVDEDAARQRNHVAERAYK